MIATNKLRFVKRIKRTGEPFMLPPEETILQQWWEEDGGDYDGLGEWRDVPIEEQA